MTLGVVRELPLRTGDELAVKEVTVARAVADEDQPPVVRRETGRGEVKQLFVGVGMLRDALETSL